MYNIQYKCEELTGETIHSVAINDKSLADTWHVATIGEIPAHLKVLDCDCTHDLNVWFDTNDDDRDELYLSLYPLLNDPESADQAPQTDTSNPIRCEIVSVDCPKREVPEGITHVGGDEFINDGEDYFYYNEDHDKIECPICERSCYEHDLIKVNGQVMACTDCDVEDKIECEDCGGELCKSEVFPYKYEPDVKLCESCHEDRMKEE